MEKKLQKPCPADCARFMASSLSNLVKIFAEKIQSIKFKYVHNDEKCETWKLNIKFVTAFMNMQVLKMILIGCKSLSCNRYYLKKSDENWNKLFLNTYTFSNHDINKLILLLRKGVYSYEYMDASEKFIKTSLHEKKFFYSHLNMTDITDGDYTHEKQFVRIFRNKRFRRKSWFACSKRYIIISRCIWDLSKYVSNKKGIIGRILSRYLLMCNRYLK